MTNKGAFQSRLRVYKTTSAGEITTNKLLLQFPLLFSLQLLHESNQNGPEAEPCWSNPILLTYKCHKANLLELKFENCKQSPGGAKQSSFTIVCAICFRKK
jgi:hypothetical protein